MSDAFHAVVGVSVDEWIAADTPEKFAALIERRDHPPRCCTVEHTYADVMTVGSREPDHRIRLEPCNGVHR